MAALGREAAADLKDAGVVPVRAEEVPKAIPALLLLQETQHNLQNELTLS